MPEEASGRADFIGRQLALMKRQYGLIRCGDYDQAVVLGNELSLTLPALTTITSELRNNPESTNTHGLKEMIAEIKQLHDLGLETLIAGRDKLAQVLRDIIEGRQLLHRYRSYPETKHKLFDISG